MLSIKQKQFIKHLLLAIVVSLSFCFISIPSSRSVSAASYTCDPTTSPCCQAPQVVANGGDAGPCFDKTTGKRFYPVADNADKSPQPEVGHCYTVQLKANVFYYFDADCSNPPFNVNSTAAGQQAKIDCNAAYKDLNKSNCGIINYLLIFINVLSAMVGLVVVAVIIVAGIQFSTAGDDPQKLAAAKGRIVNALLAIAVFLFMYAFLQWVVPGGIF